MSIEIASAPTDELLTALQRLIPQLTQNNPPPAWDDLTALFADPSSTLLVARSSRGEIVGALTLTVYRVPTGVRAIIEDVIVDQSARGQGMGEGLMRRAIELAKEKGAAQVSLTSNPMRESANRLYLRMGFQKRETNSYLMKL